MQSESKQTNTLAPEFKTQSETNEDTSESKSNSLQFGVHMIDFAHSTFQGFLEDITVYQGPDRDCLYALDNLISVLENILKNSQGPS